MNAKTMSVRESEIERRWYVVDATDETLGRLASRIARVLEGKHKATYQPNLDSGDHVIVLNASRIAVTRDKLESKVYARHSGYPQGFKEETLGHLLARRPEEVIRRAVKGMLPHTRLGAQQLRKLKIYARHSGYPQGFKEETLGHLLARRPEEVIRRAVKGMLPHTRLGAQQLRKLKIYAGTDHPHQAQRPEPLA
jgi:large subunit ribosomal protein L13